MNIEQILSELKSCNPDLEVEFDFCHCTPGCIDSHRGAYDEPAISWDTCGPRPSVSELIKELEEAVSGKVFYGYKGGEFTFSLEDDLYVADPDRSSRTKVCGVVEQDGLVVLETRFY